MFLCTSVLDMGIVFVLPHINDDVGLYTERTKGIQRSADSLSAGLKELIYQRIE